MAEGTTYAHPGKAGIHKTLAAGDWDTVTLTDSDSDVEVYNRDASAAIYFTTDGVTPVAAANGTFVVGAGQAVIVPKGLINGVAIKLISSGAAPYSVTVV